MRGVFGLVAIISGVAASLLVVASILVYLGWIPAIYVDSFSAEELAAFGVLFIVLAIAASYAEKRE